MKQFRQGDVLINKIDEVPKNVKQVERDNGRTILAYGELTGHAHAISDPTATLFSESGNLDPLSFLQVMDTPVTLRHEEHSELILPPGAYEVIHQIEEDDKEAWFVAD